MKVLIVFDSETGNTEKMAHAVEEGVRKGGAEPIVKKVTDATVDELHDYAGIIVGSPVYYGTPSARIKQYFDDSVKLHGKLEGMTGGAFCSAGGTHTGAETTLMAINQMLLIHGMVVQGSSSGNHYGAAATGSPTNTNLDACRKLGERVARLAAKLRA